MLSDLNGRLLLRVFLILFTVVLSLATLHAGVIAQINFGYRMDGVWTTADPYASTTDPSETVWKMEWGGDFPPDMYIANGAGAWSEGLTFHVSANAGIYNGILPPGYPDYTYAEAFATANDMLLIASSTPGLSGTSATAIFGMHITGSIETFGPNTEAELWLDNQRLIASAGGDYDQTAYLSVPFIFGQWFAFDNTVKARAAAGPSGSPDYFVTSNASFFDTVTINGPWIYQTGQPITNFTITSQDGLSYPAGDLGNPPPIGQVPEPGVWALSGAGLLVFCIARLRR